jgi:hypothetical protein
MHLLLHFTLNIRVSIPLATFQVAMFPIRRRSQQFKALVNKTVFHHIPVYHSVLRSQSHILVYQCTYIIDVDLLTILSRSLRLYFVLNLYSKHLSY